MVLAVIPARFQATRFPGKLLADLGGITVLERVYARAKQIKKIDKLVVAGDDERIEKLCNEKGMNYQATSKLFTSGTERCLSVVTKYPNINLLINLQGDEPFFDIESLSTAIQDMKISNHEIGSFYFQTTDSDEINNPNRVKVILNKFNNAIYFSRNIIPFNCNLDEFPYKIHSGIYLFKNQVIAKLNLLSQFQSELREVENLEQINWIYHGLNIKMYKIKKNNNIAIDTPEDLILANKFLNDQNSLHNPNF